MLTWDEVINRYKTIKEAREGHSFSIIAGCMLQILPSLRFAVEGQFVDMHISLVMLALELCIPGTSRRLVLQGTDEGKFILYIKDLQYNILEEIESDVSNVVEQSIQYLKSFE